MRHISLTTIVLPVETMINKTPVSWERITNVASVLDAEMLQATLESSGIIVQLRSNAAGIWGAGYQGQVTGGVDVLVPSDRAAHARELLEL